MSFIIIENLIECKHLPRAEAKLKGLPIDRYTYIVSYTGKISEIYDSLDDFQFRFAQYETDNTNSLDEMIGGKFLPAYLINKKEFYIIIPCYSKEDMSNVNEFANKLRTKITEKSKVIKKSNKIDVLIVNI